MTDSFRHDLRNQLKLVVVVAWLVWRRVSHLSIWERNFVSKMPLVFSVSEICPRKRKPRLVRSIRICLTISPRYMPLHIFSYLSTRESLGLR